MHESPAKSVQNMGKKAEVGSVKWEANKQKAKGLQKLRWYCQMCEKQCRDENGFKCHLQSESHIRQMKIFGSQAHKFVDDFSRQFENGFMELMRTRYCRTKVLANKVYNEYIANRDHIHMNATRWVSLAGFCQYLGNTGKVTLEDSDRGWVLEYVDKEQQERDRLNNLKLRMQLNEEERKLQRINEAVEEARRQGQFDRVESTAPTSDGPVRQEKVAFKLNMFKAEPKSESAAVKTEDPSIPPAVEQAPPSKPVSAAADLLSDVEEEEEGFDDMPGAHLAVKEEVEDNAGPRSKRLRRLGAPSGAAAPTTGKAPVAALFGGDDEEEGFDAPAPAPAKKPLFKFKL